MGDEGSISGLGRSPGGGHAKPLQYSCLENSMDRGTWQATQSIGSQRVGHDWSDQTCTHIIHLGGNDSTYKSLHSSFKFFFQKFKFCKGTKMKKMVSGRVYICCYCYCEVTSVVSDSVRPHRQQPTRLPHPWDSPGKNTGVGCHFLLPGMKVKWKGSRSVVSDPQRPHGLQPSRLLHPWVFPGKSTGVGCHCLLWGLHQSAVNKLYMPRDSSGNPQSGLQICSQFP